MKTYVLDSSALILFLRNEPGAAKVREVVGSTQGGGHVALMSVVNWGEVYHYMWRGWGQAAAESTLVDIARLPLRLVDADAPTAKLAATIKVRFGLAFADCFAAALAWSRRAAVVTADHDFRVLKKQIELLLV